MDSGSTRIAGIEIPSVDLVFLTIVAIHVVLGLTAVVAGAVAMLSSKKAGRHPRAGRVYFWCLAALALTAVALALVRWSEDYHLFILAVLAFVAALLGRSARRRQACHWARHHILGMGLSYVFVLTAFYVDNGKSLPLWDRLPQIAYWLLPAAVGLPLIVHAMLRHPLVRRRSGSA